MSTNFFSFNFSLDVDRCRVNYTVFSDAIGFVKQVTRLNNVVLGVRWVTCKRANYKDGSYNKSDIDEMYNLLKEAGVDKMKEQAINILIRGHYANRSRDNLMDLYKKLNETNPVTFTIYTDEQYWFNETTDDPNKPKRGVTPQNIEDLRAVIRLFGAENIYLQTSDDIRSELDLHGLSNPRALYNSTSSFVYLNFILANMFIAVKLIENFVFDEINDDV